MPDLLIIDFGGSLWIAGPVTPENVAAVDYLETRNPCEHGLTEIPAAFKAGIEWARSAAPELPWYLEWQGITTSTGYKVHAVYPGDQLAVILACNPSKPYASWVTGIVYPHTPVGEWDNGHHVATLPNARMCAAYRSAGILHTHYTGAVVPVK